MYVGGLQVSLWAFDFGYFIASANPRDGSRIVDPLGRVLVTSDAAYEPVISRRVNLDYAVIHLDYNGRSLPALKEKYGADAHIDVARPEAVACLYSQATGVRVAECSRGSASSAGPTTSHAPTASERRPWRSRSAGPRVQEPAAPAARVRAAVVGAPVA